MILNWNTESENNSNIKNIIFSILMIVLITINNNKYVLHLN